uniref:Uncharacterized protein n=1 Tax=Ditylenchus dipsaci TaxID=166011 RepID=A0A915DL57_9BILA
MRRKKDVEVPTSPVHSKIIRSQKGKLKGFKALVDVAEKWAKRSRADESDVSDLIADSDDEAIVTPSTVAELPTTASSSSLPLPSEESVKKKKKRGRGAAQKEKNRLYKQKRRQVKNSDLARLPAMVYRARSEQWSTWPAFRQWSTGPAPSNGPPGPPSGNGLPGPLRAMVHLARLPAMVYRARSEQWSTWPAFRQWSTGLF